MPPFYRLIICAAFLVINCSCNHIPDRTKTEDTIPTGWKKMPDSWIKKAMTFSYKKKDTTLLTEFANAIKPDTIYDPHAQHVDPDYGFIFNTISADLDGDGGNELLCLQGWDVYSPYLCVFKQLNDNWYLIYMEEAETFYSSPTLYIANNYSRNKTFYLRRVYDHGSGIYVDGYSFYKLTNNRVYKCLDIVNDAHIYGWGLYLNQAVTSSFEFDGDSTDQLFVRYTYNFFPGSINDADCSWCAHEDVPLIKGDDGVNYVYNDKEHQYKLDIAKYKNGPEDLTAEKIACFAAFGNDTLFVKAYGRQIDTTLKIGTSQQKKILRKYLAIVEKDKKARTEELEVKTKAGGTTFYGPKKGK